MGQSAAAPGGPWPAPPFGPPQGGESAGFVGPPDGHPETGETVGAPPCPPESGKTSVLVPT
eukprot:10343325-Alexandrium_andersonii.AAC.1